MSNEECNFNHNQESSNENREYELDNRRSEDEQVGFCRPPKHSRFKKGESGNPTGRPKKRRESVSNSQEILSKELQEEVLITEEGKQRKKSKLTLLYKSLVNDAIKGKASAQRLLFKLMENMSEPADFVTTDAEIAILKSYLGDPDIDENSPVQDDSDEHEAE